MKSSLRSKCAKEVVGTFVLTLVGTAIAAVVTNSVSVGLAFGLTLVIIAYTLKAHCNPAVTVGMTVGGESSWAHLPSLIVSQYVGAWTASLFLSVFGGSVAQKGMLGLAVPGKGIHSMQVFGIEMIFAAILVYAVRASGDKDRTNPAVSGLIAGLGLFVAIAAAHNYTGGAINPARDFGPVFFTGQYAAFWAYQLGPLVGGLIGSLMYELLADPVKVKNS